jgi:aspartate carbamoyltransferase catalytic subunit
VKKGETLVDTVNNILAMKVDMVVMRHPHPGAPHFLANKVDTTIVNAGDGTHEHPTQALLDSFSIREKLGHDLEGKKIAIVGDIRHSRVALSNILALKLQGATVRVCGPATLISKHMESLGVEVSHDLDETLAWADVANMLRIQLERQGDDDAIRFFPSIREYTMNFGLTTERLKRLDKELVILHPGPINRGVEISSEIADSEHAIILDQVENGVATRMAIMYLLANR